MVDTILYISSIAVIAAIVIVFVLPMIVFLCVRSGSAAYFMTKKRFTVLEKGECDECKRSTSGKNVSSPPPGGTAREWI